MANEFIARKGLIVSGSTTVTSNVSANGNITAGTNLVSSYSSGDEGGELLLAKPQTNSTIAGTGVTIDIYQNKLRIFEQGGTARGGYYDITALAAGVATNLAGGSGTVTSIVAGNGLTGGTITSTGTITVDTGSAHFITGSTKVLDLKGVISSSIQQVVSTYTNATDNRVLTSTGTGGINAESTLTYDGTVLAISTNGAKYFQGGDDAALYDVNVANTLGIHGQQDSTVGAIKLGSAGQTIYSNATGVGIATTSPGATLHVQGNVSASSFTGSFAGTATTASGLSGGTANYIPLWTSATAQSSSTIYQSSANIGIGTTSPSSRLAIQNTGATDNPVVELRLINGANAATFRTTDSPVTFGIHSQNNGNIYIKDTFDNVLFYGKDGGNVGIGTTTPGATLHVQGNVSASSFTGSLSGNASTVTNGVYTNGSYADPTWITSLAGSKISGNITGNAANITAYTINQNLGTSNSPSFVTITSTQATGTAPFTVASRTVVSNLNADLLDGLDSTAFATTSSNTLAGIQTISNTTDSTAFNNGALIVQGGLGVAKNVNISGSLTVTGILTAVSSSIQYVTSSQLNVSDNKITVQSNDLVRFGGLSVYDSGSTSATASIYWDSLNHQFIYENLGGSSYTSAILIAGPVNRGTLGSETGLVTNRVPVATGGDHIDSGLVSSSIRVDFPSRFTHIEAGLHVTGSVTSSVGFSGNGANITNVTAASVAYTNITGLPTLVSSSGQIDHNATTNYVANRHIDHTAVSISTSTGLTGGGDISSTRTLALTGQALAFHNLASNGLVARTAADTVAARSIAVSGTGLSIANADGVSGNPTITIGGGLYSSSAQITSLGASVLTGTIPSSVLGNSTVYIGTTAIALNRSSASQTLTGINIDGTSANITAYTINQSVGTSNAPTFNYVIFKDSINANTYGFRGLSGVITCDGGAQYPTAWNFQYGNTSTSAMYITSSGNVGIGTTTPSSLLHLYTTSTTAELLIEKSNSYAVRTGVNSSNIGYFGSNNATPVQIQTNASARIYVDTSGNVGIATTSPSRTLTVNGSTNITGSLDVTGAFTAQTKSFKIDHQRLPGKSLVYGVLEGPEHAVYTRGRLTNNNIIQLPEEWEWLVDEASITVQLTPIGTHQQLYVETIENNQVVINGDVMDCFYLVHATRKDVELLDTVQ
jgi:hypothetical protein